MRSDPEIVADLRARFGASVLGTQPTADGIPTVWCEAGAAHEMLRHLKAGIPKPFQMLFDLTAIDERNRVNREGQPAGAFTVVYHLLSVERNEDIRLKVPLAEPNPSMTTATDLWPSAAWYECEIWDMFGIRATGHPHLRRLLMPQSWEGHPLRKDHPARATELGPFSLSEATEAQDAEQERFKPEDWGLARRHEDADFMFLNIGPQHPGTHGVLRIVLQLDGEQILDAVPDIGYHHRGAEKMGERQSWHTYIPYTDRIDYLSGVINNFAYCLSVEKLAGIEVPDRAKVIRIMMAELFHLASHLVWYGTFAQDLGQLSPVFYMFTDRERLFEIVEAITGARMHPNWFRIGGVAQDLPNGWQDLVRAYIDYQRRRLTEYDHMVMANPIFTGRTRGIGGCSTETALEWGMSGPNLRATGLAWDLRKKRPYGGYEQFDFDVPTGTHGDCYDRAVVHVEEMRQSLRILEQCLKRMPPGPYKSAHPLATPPLKDLTMHDIETLITHFLGVSWGPVIPPGEACVTTEGSKGMYAYYLISDGNTVSYRTRIRTPSFPHLQMLPLLTRGSMIPDLVAVLGSLDYVLADVDR